MRRRSWFHWPLFISFSLSLKTSFLCSCTFITQTASVCSARTVPETTFILFRLHRRRVGVWCRAINFPVEEKRSKNSCCRLSVSRRIQREMIYEANWAKIRPKSIQLGSTSISPHQRAHQLCDIWDSSQFFFKLRILRLHQKALIKIELHSENPVM